MSVDLGPVELLGAESVGQPGQRRFRLFAEAGRSSIVIWMEKDQLNSLSLALDRVLAEITEGQVLRTEAQVGGQSVPSLPTNFPIPPTYEFQVGNMRISYDEQAEQFQLNAIPLEIIMEHGQEPQVVLNEEGEVSFIFSQQQAQSLSKTIVQVVSAGRPTCPFCGTPLVEGVPHACVKQNGHREIIKAEEVEDDEEE